MINYIELLTQVEQHAEKLFTDNHDVRRVYHDLAHTQAVVQAARQIGSHYNLEDADFFAVISAAWFHDVGYFLDASNHESAGADAIADFLQQEQVPADLIEIIKTCILATKLPQKPTTLLQQIVCDADLFHLGTTDFSERNKLMRKEFNAFAGKEQTKDAWRAGTIQLLESHHYHTDYAKLLLNKTKQGNIDELKLKAEKSTQKLQAENEIAISKPLANEDAVAAQKIKKQKDDRPSRGIETMFRISSGNHQRLSDQADSKSQILITVNSIIISVILSVLLRSLEEYPHLQIPAFLLLTVNVVTIVCAIIATRPNIPPGTFTQHDIDEKKVNLLFFGNFYNMSLQDYAGGMMKMMEDRDFLYGSLIRDVYAQGVVLGRKYRMLRVAYNIFMYGLIISVLAFIGAVISA